MRRPFVPHLDLDVLIDFDALRARAADDEDLLREVLTDFLGAVDSMLAEAAASPRAAHKLRGALLALCAERAASAAFDVETEQNAANLARLHAEVAALLREIRAYLG